MTKRYRVHRNGSRQGGFTLLEVLLAFVIFSLSFAVVLQIISGSIRNTMRSKQYTEIALIAQSVMDTVGLDVPLESGTEVSGESGEYDWSLQIYDYEPPVTESGVDTLFIAELTNVELLQVDLSISWGEPPDDRSRRFTTVKSVLGGRGP